MIVAALLSAPAEAGPPCRGASIGTAFAGAALDGRTVQLADGRELRLAGIEPPDAGHSRAAAQALQALVAGRELTLARLGADTDRYGRVSALVFAEAGAPSLQAAMLARGLARVAARVGEKACAAEFLSREEGARAAGLGLWSDPASATKAAENPADILAARGRFAVVEGMVLSVRESGGTIYVNFGTRWSQDFTVTIPKRDERRFSAAGQVLQKLAGRRVRVRGTVEERGGPWIEARHPEQIEVAERQ